MAPPVVVGLVALAVGLVPVAVRAGQAPSPGAPVAAPPSVTTEPEVVLALADPDEKVFAWRDSRVQLSVINGSLPSGIGIKSLKLSIPSMLGLAVVGANPSGGSVELIPSAIRLRTPGERRDFPPVELKGRPWRELGWQVVPLLMYRPRKEVFVATLEYEGLADGQAGTATAKLVTPVSAHPLGMYLGAILGSLLAAVFLVLPPLRRPKGATHPEPFVGPPERYPLRDFAVRFVRGSVVTAIAVLVLQTTSEFALPINLTVHDFYGGILLGLFGDKIGERLSRWLWG